MFFNESIPGICTLGEGGGGGGGGGQYISCDLFILLIIGLG